MSITKEMLAKCQNDECRPFFKLPEDVQGAILKSPEYAERLDAFPAKWVTCKKDQLYVFYPGNIYRLDPKTPVEQEFEEYHVVIGPDGVYAAQDPTARGALWHLYEVVVAARFLGIVYQKDGVETLRTSIDAAFGIPVRVRFAK